MNLSLHVIPQRSPSNLPLSTHPLGDLSLFKNKIGLALTASKFLDDLRSVCFVPAIAEDVNAGQVAFCITPDEEFFR